MKNNAIGILSILFIILLLVIYYISVCGSTVENFKDSKNERTGKKVLDAKKSVLDANSAIMFAIHKLIVAYQEIKYLFFSNNKNKIIKLYRVNK